MLWSIWESRHWCLKGNALWAFRKQVTLICWVLHIIDRWYQGRTVTKSWFFTPCSQGWRKICSRVCFQQAGTVILGGLGFFLLLVFSFCLLRKHCAALPIFASRGTEAKKKGDATFPAPCKQITPGQYLVFQRKVAIPACGWGMHLLAGTLSVSLSQQKLVLVRPPRSPWVAVRGRGSDTVWTSLCKGAWGENRMGKCHVHFSRDSLRGSWPPLCSFYFQGSQTSLVLSWSPAHATQALSMLTFCHPFSIIHAALVLIFREV